ncbi:unnamed protein product [Ilex paraguariensis]|uniref:Uncharacterized protein n=1 Tax=Ilex paraguariensis TaxID=185542 RepID=A0ABC8RX84_9AQUA
MDKGYDILGNNSIEDVRWLCSLSESELDFLISLKMLVIQRAKKIGQEALANKFDLRMLRALGFILMEHFSVQVKDVSVIPCLAESSAFLAGCNLLKHNLDDSFSNMSIEDLKALVGSDQRKRIAEMFVDEIALNQKRKL